MPSDTTIICQCLRLTFAEAVEIHDELKAELNRAVTIEDMIEALADRDTNTGRPRCHSCAPVFNQVLQMQDERNQSTESAPALCSFEGRQGAGPVPATQAGQPLILSNIPIIAADHPANQK